MKQLFIVMIICLFTLGCKDSSYDPGSLANNPPETNETQSDNNTQDDPDDEEVLTSIDTLGIDLQKMISAIQQVYLSQLTVLLSMNPGIQNFFGSFGNINWPSLLDPEQALLDAITSEDCEVYVDEYEVSVSGEGCPLSLYYWLEEDEFYVEYYINDESDESLLEFSDIYAFYMKGERYDDDELAISFFEMDSDTYGYLSGEMSRYSEFYEGGYYQENVIYLYLDDFEGDDFLDDIDEVSLRLFNLFNSIELMLSGALDIPET